MIKAPKPQGKYIPASRYNNIIYTSGMTPRENGILLYKGKALALEPIEKYKKAVRLATCNAIAAAKSMLVEGENIEKILNLTVYINSEENFTDHSKIADFSSQYLHEQLGESGISSRTSVGVVSLPGNATIEIQLIAIAKQ